MGVDLGLVEERDVERVGEAVIDNRLRWSPLTGSLTTGLCPVLFCSKSLSYCGAMVLSLPERVRVSPELVVRKSNDGAVLVDLAGQGYYGLDRVGVRMLQLLEKHD